MYRTLNDVIQRDAEMTDEIRSIAHRLSADDPLPPLSRQARIRLGQRKRWLLKARDELRSTYNIRGMVAA